MFQPKPATENQIKYIRQLMRGLVARVDNALNQSRQHDPALVPTFEAQLAVLKRLAVPPMTMYDASKVIDALRATMQFVIRFPEFVNDGTAAPRYQAEGYQMLKDALKPPEQS